MGNGLGNTSACVALVAVTLTAAAHANGVGRAGASLERSAGQLVSTATCPAGVPVQAITTVNQAHARGVALRRVENAVRDQSMQLQAACGTPCVQFGPGGWALHLRVGGLEWGVRYAAPTRIEVYNAGRSYDVWSTSFSHEVLETLVDPATTYDWTGGVQESNVEVADPVETRTYRLDGVMVSDFVFPAWYAGAQPRM